MNEKKEKNNLICNYIKQINEPEHRSNPIPPTIPSSSVYPKRKGNMGNDMIFVIIFADFHLLMTH